MKRQTFSKQWMVMTLLSLPMLANAAAPSWQIIPNESTLIFTGTQNGSPAVGGFKKFTGTINFDPKQLSTSNVHIVVDMNSLTSSYSDLTSTLATGDWFNIKMFPEAIFDASNFKELGNNKYQAVGTLSIRDKKAPVTLIFNFKELSQTKADVQGSTSIKRTQFGVGQGEWADTSTVKDDVGINFHIIADKK